MNKNTTSPLAALVAIDWADQKHDIALLPAGAEQPELLQLPHRPQDLAHWIAGLRQRFGGQKVAVAVEQKRGALIHALMATNSSSSIRSIPPPWPTYARLSSKVGQKTIHSIAICYSN